MKLAEVEVYMKIILMDSSLVRTFFGNNFFDSNFKVCTLENNYFLVHAKLGCLL